MSDEKQTTGIDKSCLKVFDAHAHAFPDKVAAFAMPKLVEEALWQEVHPSTDGTLQGLLDSMEKSGFAKSVLCSVATRPEQVEKITDWSATVDSQQVVAFASVHPDYEQPEQEMERIAGLGLKGIKFHPQYMNCALDDARTIRIARAAAECGLAMACHSGYDLAYEKDELAGPGQLLALHEAVPELRLQGCHLGGWRRWEEVIECVAGQPIYLETSFCLGQCPEELLEVILQKHPSEYLMFGTDVPWADAGEMLDLFLGLSISDEAKRMALWDNTVKWTGIEESEE